MRQDVKVYLGLGGNIGDSAKVISQALTEIIKLPEITNLQVSSFYWTSPVGNLDLDPFVNAVCCFHTTLKPNPLLKKIQAIEIKLGKVPKAKYEARPIDIDILFYGSFCYSDTELEIPHPHWKERLFVLVPLADLTAKIDILTQHHYQSFVLDELIHDLQSSCQIVSLVEKKFYLH